MNIHCDSLSSLWSQKVCLVMIRASYLANIMTICNMKIQSTMFLAYMSRYKMSSISASTWTTLITFRQCRNTKAVDLTLFPYLEVVLTLIYNGFRGPVRSFHAPFISNISDCKLMYVLEFDTGHRTRTWSQELRAPQICFRFCFDCFPCNENVTGSSLSPKTYKSWIFFPRGRFSGGSH